MTNPVLAGHEIWAVASRGAHRGEIMIPKRQQRGPFKGLFVVSPDRFERNYVGLSTILEVKAYIAKGYSVRLFPATRSGPPSLFTPASVHGWR